jgi:transposase-like protein
MNINNFFSDFSTESACKLYFKTQRESKGIVCSKCESTQHYWIENLSRWQCKVCRKSVSLKYGTIMENSNLPYKTWLWGIYFSTLTKKGFSALEMQRLLGHSRYESIWLMMHKIRVMMGARDEKYKLDKFIEMDEGYFPAYRKKDNNDGLVSVPAKELDRNVKAIVAVSATPLSNAESKEDRPVSIPHYIKINVVESISKIDVAYEAKQMVSKNAAVITDGKTSYRVLDNIIKKHKEVIVKDKEEISRIFPWVHIAISNVRKKILGLHHSVKDTYMQNYLNEFCYKFNRRKHGKMLFHNFLNVATSYSWYAQCTE